MTMVGRLRPASGRASRSPLAAAKNAVSVGVAPVAHGMPPEIDSLITGIAHATFMSGMRAAFVVAAFVVEALVALAGALIALLARPGNGGAEGMASFR